MEARPGITKRSYASAGFCSSCCAAAMVTHYDRTIPGYLCKGCAPQAIYIDLLLVNLGMHHPTQKTPNN